MSRRAISAENLASALAANFRSWAQRYSSWRSLRRRTLPRRRARTSQGFSKRRLLRERDWALGSARTPRAMAPFLTLGMLVRRNKFACTMSSRLLFTKAGYRTAAKTHCRDGAEKRGEEKKLRREMCGKKSANASVRDKKLRESASLTKRCGRVSKGPSWLGTHFDDSFYFFCLFRRTDTTWCSIPPRGSASSLRSMNSESERPAGGGGCFSVKRTLLDTRRCSGASSGNDNRRESFDSVS